MQRRFFYLRFQIFGVFSLIKKYFQFQVCNSGGLGRCFSTLVHWICCGPPGISSGLQRFPFNCAVKFVELHPKNYSGKLNLAPCFSGKPNLFI